MKRSDHARNYEAPGGREYHRQEKNPLYLPTGEEWEAQHRGPTVSGWLVPLLCATLSFLILAALALGLAWAISNLG